MRACDFLRLIAGAAFVVGACGDGDDAAESRSDASSPDGGSTSDAAADAPAADGWTDAPGPPPTPRDPCGMGQCWSAPALGGTCGTASLTENFSTGNYNVHDYALTLAAGVTADVMLTATGGAWQPALLVLAQDGTTLYDGELALSGGDPQVTPASSGKNGDAARILVTPKTDTTVGLFVTGWSVIDGGFVPSLPTDATYSLSTVFDCELPPPGQLLTPPNFDPTNVQNGFYQLPPSQPPGLYTLKGPGCSWGTKLLIDVIYTVATHWKPLYPTLSPLEVKDLNENVAECTTNHDTHADGTHVDIVAGCATDITCEDKLPKIALAKLFIDTGVACGILNNDEQVHDEVNAYFAQKTSYAPWNGQFMRTVTGHVAHFHVRVQKPDGTCN